MPGETRAPEGFLVQTVHLDHRSHGAVENENSLR
jgi:hypothetical protein